VTASTGSMLILSIPLLYGQLTIVINSQCSSTAYFFTSSLLYVGKVVITAPSCILQNPDINTKT
jgi:hypothetical protein